MKGSWRKLALLTIRALLIASISSLMTIQFLGCPHYGRHLLKIVLLRKDQVDPQTEFRLYMSTAEAGPKGVTIDGQTYRATDCVTVFSGFYKFSTVAEAEEDIRQRLKSSYRVFEHSKPSGAAVDTAPERVVMKFEKKGNYFILLRQENRIHEISSESLPHARLFEQQHSFLQ